MSEETSTHQGQGEIIIVKKVQGGGGGHHGGAWKIAYADFVTAMMAFFLVMWLVNAANEDTKASVASYFNPIKLTDQKPSEKGVKQAGESSEGEQTSAASKSEGDEETTGEGAADGNQETSTAGEESENSEADYFENPYAVLSEIVMDSAEESNISEKGDGGAQTSGSATGASGGEAYRDPFDPDFWSKQITSTDAEVETAAAGQNQDETEDELGQNFAKTGGASELDMGAGDVFDKSAGAGDLEESGAGLSDYDTGGNKSGMAEFDGDQGGKEFDTDGQMVSNLPDEDFTSKTLPPGDVEIEEIDPDKLAKRYAERKEKIEELEKKAEKQRLTEAEAEHLHELFEARNDGEELHDLDKMKMEQLLAKNEAAKEVAIEIAELQNQQRDDEAMLAGYPQQAGQGKVDEMAMDESQEGLTEAEKLEVQIRKATGGVLGKLSEGLAVTPTEGGLLLSLTDQENVGMFNVGSAVPKREMILLMDKIGRILQERDGSIAIRGHTDARPFSNGGNDNWRLSMSRAHSAYFMLVRSGIPEDRIDQVTGFADRRLKVPDDPYSALNRRIEILIESKEG